MTKTVKSATTLLTTLGLLAVIVVVPGTISFSQENEEQDEEASTAVQNDNNTNTDTAGGREEQSLLSNGTRFSDINQTTTTASEEEQSSMLARTFIENMTSGETKVIMITMSRQSGVPVQQELRDIDPLGFVNFTDGTTTALQVMRPDYASGENLTSILYTGGQLSFMFENLAIPTPDDIDIVFISESVDDMRSPIVIDDAGFDNEFVVPGLENDKSYLVLVSMHWTDLGQDVLMGIDGRAVDLEEIT